MNGSEKALNLGVLAAGAIVYLAATSQAFAQNAPNCGPRATVVERLSEGYGETRRSVGLGSNNAVVEVFASDETGTWTITVTRPNGLTCLVASGRSFENIFEASPTRDTDV